jgi:hypothetical protein
MYQKDKVKCILVQALRLCTGRTAHRVCRGIALLFLDHGTRWGEGSALRPSRSLPSGKTRNPLFRRPGGPQGRSGQVRKISPPTGIRSPDRPARSQSLYRLRYPAHLIYQVVTNFLALITNMAIKTVNWLYFRKSGTGRNLCAFHCFWLLAAVSNDLSTLSLKWVTQSASRHRSRQSRWCNELPDLKFVKSVHHHTVQINHQLDATVSPVYYLDVYLQLNMFRTSSRPSSGAQQVQ